MSKKALLLAFGLPLLILLLLTAQPVATMTMGQEISLETVPIDPTDLFRGDFVRLEYKISTVELSQMPGQIQSMEQDYRQLQRQQLYAVLKQSGEYHVIDYITPEKPKDRLYIKCSCDYITDNGTNSGKVAHLNYHLDSYFVAENTGLQLEEQSRKGEVVAKVKVFNGYALLTGVAPR